MLAILKLDLAGQPRRWLTVHEAVTAYATGRCALWHRRCSTPNFRWHSAINRLALANNSAANYCDCRSYPRCVHAATVQSHAFSPRRSILASIAANGLTGLHSPVTMSSLFLVVGETAGENVVAACKRCNWIKDNKTPEEAGMPLLAIPFRPNAYEWHFLAKERVLTDQMHYLSKQFKAHRAWAH